MCVDSGKPCGWKARITSEEGRLLRPFCLALAAVALAAAASAAPIEGTKPAYLQEVATTFANHEAVGRRIWAPGLDEGYTPQGLALAGDYILVSAYREVPGRGPECRVFRIHAKAGEPAGRFDVPGCEHAGGLANVGGGLLVIADTRRLWRVDMEKAFAAGKLEGALRGTVGLAGEVHGEFASFDGTDLWIGRYTVRKEAAKAKIHRVPLKLFDELDGRDLDESKVAETLPSPPLGQGMAFQGRDTIWIASSSSQIGWLHRIERATGKVLERYDTVIGIEGIAFAEGQLWGVSEAGAKKYQHWKAHFPLVFTIDPAKLR